MTEDDLDNLKRAGAELEGLTPEEVEAHLTALKDLGRLHAGPFTIETLRELFAALQRVQEQIDAATWRRLSARSLTINEYVKVAEDQIQLEILRDYQGPAH